nr:(2Fe-2S)-binding protein [Spongiibacter pelagi]
MEFTVNGVPHRVDTDPEQPLLWLLREQLQLTGTKFGCGMGLCGACTVHIDGAPMRSCTLPAVAAQGRVVTTIEGIGVANGELHPVQSAWLLMNVPQCGYCQSGQVMSAVALLNSNPKPSDDDIDNAMSGNLCRCGTYPRIRAAIHLAASEIQAVSYYDPREQGLDQERSS